MYIHTHPKDIELNPVLIHHVYTLYLCVLTEKTLTDFFQCLKTCQKKAKMSVNTVDVVTVFPFQVGFPGVQRSAPAPA